MRLPYVTDPPPVDSPADQEVVNRIRRRRAPLPLVEVDRTLLHSTAIADGWNSFFGNIRMRTSLTQDIREIVICRVAALNQAWYEWGHHYPLLLAAPEWKMGDGLGSALRDAAIGDWKANENGLSPKQAAVLQYTDILTRKVKVPQEIFDELKSHCSGEKEIVEITATIASYNLVSRFLVALDVGEKNNDRETA